MLSLGELGVVIGTAAFLASLPLAGAEAHAPDPAELTTRYAGQGWADFSQASAPFVGSGSSQAIIALPAGATIDWAGLYWGSGPAARTECAPTRATAVRLSLGEGPTEIRAASLGGVGDHAYQAYADITSVVAGTPRGLRVVTVSGVASARGCAGGWTILVAYSYVDGPHQTYAESYRFLTVYDGILAVRPGDIQIGLAPAGDTRVTAAVLGDGSLRSGGDVVPLEATGTGYRTGTGPLAPGPLTLSSTRYAGLVLGITATDPERVDLAMAASASVGEVDVGSTTTLRLSVLNRGEVPVSGIVIVAKLPTTLALLAAVDEYEAGTGIWTPRSIAAHNSATLTLQVLVRSAGVHPWHARVAAAAIGDHDLADDRATVVVTGLTAAGSSPIVGPSRAVPVPVAATTSEPAGGSWASVPAGAYFAVALAALSLMVPLTLRLGRPRWGVRIGGVSSRRVGVASDSARRARRGPPCTRQSSLILAAFRPWGGS